MRLLYVITAICVSLLPLAVPAADQAPTPALGAAASTYTTEDTDIGTLLDNPASRAVLDQRIPTVSKGENISMARAMTLRALQQFAPDVLTDEVLAQIDADLAKLKAK